jgi:hypothetical protein
LYVLVILIVAVQSLYACHLTEMFALVIKSGGGRHLFTSSVCLGLLQQLIFKLFQKKMDMFYIPLYLVLGTVAQHMMSY